MDAVEFVKQLRCMDKSVIRKYSVFNDSQRTLLPKLRNGQRRIPSRRGRACFLSSIRRRKLTNMGACGYSQSSFLLIIGTDTGIVQIGCV